MTSWPANPEVVVIDCVAEVCAGGPGERRPQDEVAAIGGVGFSALPGNEWGEKIRKANGTTPFGLRLISTTYPGRVAHEIGALWHGR